MTDTSEKYGIQPLNNAKRRSGKFLKVLILGLSIVGVSPARVSAQSISDSAQVEFRQSHSHLDLNLGDNGRNLSRLLAAIRSAKSDSLPSVPVKIVVKGAASPEGSAAFNKLLSEKRAESIYDYFSGELAVPRSKMDFIFLGRDWRGLKDLVEKDLSVPDRTGVISLISEYLDQGDMSAAASNALLARLKALKGGVPYSYMYRNLFPRLRFSTLIVEFLKPEPASQPVVTDPLPASPVPPVQIEDVDTVAGVEPDYVAARKPFYMAVKTNMLYDAAALPNIGVEFYLGRNWSVSADWTYGWWDNDSKHRYWRAYGGEVAVRRWFGPKAKQKPLTGHHLGIYGGAFTYDFEFGGRGYMGGIPGGTLWDRCMVTAGVEYGFSLPVAKRINIDFTIGVGYIGGKYVKYDPSPYGGYIWKSIHRLNWFGPTKAEITLVWLIGHGNTNPRK